MKAAILALLVACGGDEPDPQPCVDLDGSTCHAAYGLADSICARGERCYPETADAYDVCMLDVVSYLCAENDCAAPYADSARLEECNRIYDEQACVTISPVNACQL